jgi:DedD protein
MAKQLMEDENSLKRQARRRLIGAAVLATVVAAVLPMLLDREPKSVVKDVELRIPDKEKAGEFVPNVALPSVPAAQTPGSPAEIASAPAISGTAIPVATQQPTSKPVAAQANAAVPEQKAAPAKAEEKPAEAAQKAQGQAAQTSGFIVQIGAFSNADTAYRWHKNLVKQGVKAFTEKVGDKVRVRAGPYATREAAEKVRHRLESQGLHPNVVEID